MKLLDMEILQQIVHGQIRIEDLDEDTIDRLIDLCSNRLKEINNKIENKEKEILKRRQENGYNN